MSALRRALRCLPLVGVLCAAAVPVAHGQSLSALFDEGNRALAAGDAADAAALYEQLVDAGVHDADVFVNLGIAYARSERYGRAAYAFERALAIAPGDAQARQNLDQARSALGKRQAELHGEALIQRRPTFLQSLVRSVREPVLSWTLVAVSALFFLVLAVAPRAHRESLRVAAGLAVPVLGVLFALSLGAVLLAADVFNDGTRATVLDADAPMLDAPDPRARTMRHLAEGDSVRVLGHHGDYDEVRAGQLRGWVPRVSVGSF